MRILEEKELLSQRYSVKLRYCASGPPGLIEIIFDISKETFIAFAIIIFNYMLSHIDLILCYPLILKFVMLIFFSTLPIYKM